MAKVLYCGLRGIDVDEETRSLSVNYSKKLFVTPWRDASDSSTQAYARRFFDALRHMGNSTKMIEGWQQYFDAKNTPKDADQARVFIAKFFREHLHYPRDYHDFVCQRRDIQQGSVLDFPIEYPISVEFWAIHLTVEGSATLAVGSDSISLHPGSIAIIPPGCHCRISRDSSSPHWSYHWLSFRSKLDWIELLDWATELTRPVSFTVEDSTNFDYLTTQSERLESTTYLPDSLSERLCNNIIENILLSIRLFSEKETGEASRTNPKVQGAVDFILNHYGDDISLADIAKCVNSSPVRLSALFREHFGISVIKWRDQIRMQKAKELVIHGHDSISSIANRVGYSDALYFSRRFKAHFGVAPSHLRSLTGSDSRSLTQLSAKPKPA